MDLNGEQGGREGVFGGTGGLYRMGGRGREGEKARGSEGEGGKREKPELCPPCCPTGGEAS